MRVCLQYMYSIVSAKIYYKTYRIVFEHGIVVISKVCGEYVSNINVITLGILNGFTFFLNRITNTTIFTSYPTYFLTALFLLP